MKHYRYVYVKAGDAVQEVQDLAPQVARGTLPKDGPFVFTASFLRLARGHDALLLSTTTRFARTRLGRVCAVSLPYQHTGPASWLMKPLLLLLTLGRILFFRPRVVVCPLIGPPLWTSWLAARLAGATFIHSRHNLHQPAQRPLMRRLVRTVDERAFAAADALLCHGELLRRQLLELGISEKRIHRFEIGFADFAEGGPGSTSPAPPKTPYLLFAGRIHRNKGVFDLLAAFEQVSRDHPNLALVYAGNGPHLDELKARAAASAVAPRTHFPGALSRDELAAWMRGCRFVLTPTRLEFPEGRCMVTAEAFVLGKTVVAPDYGPFRFYLDHGHDAWLYTPNSRAALASAMDVLLNDNELLDRLERGATRAAAGLMYADVSFEEAMAEALRATGTLPPEEARP